jgi:hypothetical protein
MRAALPDQDLDQILSLQLALAWAGEAAGGESRRLGWWRTDLIDEEGGGDLWGRLLPRTRRWAGLDAARRAARLTDEKLRKPLARSDAMRTLFHFGFELDEALDERLAQHKLDAHPPAHVLPLLAALASPFEEASFRSRIAASSVDASFKIVPGGRKLKAAAGEAVPSVARRLAFALLEAPPKAYPVAYVLMEGERGGR